MTYIALKIAKSQKDTPYGTYIIYLTSHELSDEWKTKTVIRCTYGIAMETTNKAVEWLGNFYDYFEKEKWLSWDDSQIDNESYWLKQGKGQNRKGYERINPSCLLAELEVPSKRDDGLINVHVLFSKNNFLIDDIDYRRPYKPKTSQKVDINDMEAVYQKYMELKNKYEYLNDNDAEANRQASAFIDFSDNHTDKTKAWFYNLAEYIYKYKFTEEEREYWRQKAREKKAKAMKGK